MKIVLAAILVLDQILLETIVTEATTPKASGVSSLARTIVVRGEMSFAAT